MAKMYDLKVIEIELSVFNENYGKLDLEECYSITDFFKYLVSIPFSSKEVMEKLVPIMDNYTLKQVERSEPVYYRITFV